MADPPNPHPALDLIDTARTRYDKTEAEHLAARDGLVAAVVAALKAGEAPTDVARRSKFTDTYVRRLAREAGIPPAAAGMKPGRRRKPG